MVDICLLFYHYIERHFGIKSIIQNSWLIKVYWFLLLFIITIITAKCISAAVKTNNILNVYFVTYSVVYFYIQCLQGNVIAYFINHF